MKKLLILAVALLVTGCGVLSFSNDAGRDILVSQVVYRLIDAADDPSDRANDIVEVTGKVRSILDAGTTATVGDLFAAIELAVEWDSLSRADQALIRDVLTLVELDLSAAYGNDALVRVDELLEVVERVAQAYAD